MQDNHVLRAKFTKWDWLFQPGTGPLVQDQPVLQMKTGTGRLHTVNEHAEKPV